MNRAERRRNMREQEKARTATYNLTQEQLEAAVRKRVGEAVDLIKREAAEEAANEAMVLLLTLPLKVLMDFYWKKSYEKRLPGFVSHVIDYYSMWQDGELDIEELRKDLWERGGIRIEEKEEGT